MSKNDNRTTVFVAVATFLGLSLVAFLVWSLTRPEEAAQAATVPVAIASSGEQTFERVAFEEFKSAVDAKLVTIIDVRSMEQYLAGHIPGALHIPVGRVEGEIPYLPKDKPVVTYCTCPAEESSGQAAMILVNGGIPAKALAGGLDEWTKRGLPVKAGVE